MPNRSIRQISPVSFAKEQQRVALQNVLNNLLVCIEWWHNWRCCPGGVYGGCYDDQRPVAPTVLDSSAHNGRGHRRLARVSGLFPTAMLVFYLGTVSKRQVRD